MQGRRPKGEITNGAPSKLAPCPAWLSPESKRAWKRSIDELTSQGAQISGLCYDALLNLAVAIGNIEVAEKEIQKFGITVLGPMGGVMKNPATTVLSQNQTQARVWAVELGLTPASVGKIPKAKGAEARKKFGVI